MKKLLLSFYMLPTCTRAMISHDIDNQLLQAAQHNDTKAVTQLLDQGANKDVADTNGYTPLHIAAQWGCVDVVKLLLDKGANSNAQDKKGRSVLSWPVSQGYPNIRTLIKQYQQLEALVDSNPKEALAKALKFKYPAFVKEIVQKVPFTAQDVEWYNNYLRELYLQTNDPVYKALAKEFILPVVRYALLLSKVPGLDSRDIAAHIASYASGITLSPQEMQKLVANIQVKATHYAVLKTNKKSSLCPIL